MYRLILSTLVLLIGCQQEMPQSAEALSETEIAQIKEEVLESFNAMMEAAQNTDADAIIELRSSERPDGFFIDNLNLYTRAQLDEINRKYWGGDNPVMLKQEIGQMQNEVVVLTPSIALVSSLLPEGSSFLAMVIR